jgi:hypothetical protein
LYDKLLTYFTDLAKNNTGKEHTVESTVISEF